jgi:hypothetical protein
MTESESAGRAIPLLISGFQGTGKSSAAAKLGGVAEIVDAERLQAQAARLVDPAGKDPYDWDLWSGDRVLQLPGLLNQAFNVHHNTSVPSSRFLVLEGAILVKDWYLCSLMGVLNVHRPNLLWERAEFLVLDFAAEEIHARIQRRAVKDRPKETSITFEDVVQRSTGYRDAHAKKSMFPWQLLGTPTSLDEALQRITSADL